MNLNTSRFQNSPGLQFNHVMALKLIRCDESINFWVDTLHDQHNKHLHRRALFKITWLLRKHSILISIRDKNRRL